MSDLKDQLIKLGAENKHLRPHIRPVLASLGKTSSRQGWADRKMAARDKFVRESFAILDKALPKVLDPQGVKVERKEQTGRFERVYHLTLGNLRFTVWPSENDILLTVATMFKERTFSVSDEFNPEKVVAALLAEMKKLV